MNSLGETVLSQTTDKDGKIGTNDLPHGSYTWQIACPGYISESFTAKVPHAGYFHNCRVQMTPWRALALRAFEHRIQECGHTDLHLGVHTPNELAAVLTASTQIDSNAVLSLTKQFEELYFGGDNTHAKDAYQAFITVLETALAWPATEEKRS
ncbi:MAG TPA: hypothetical protein EYN66_02800 [Myxococcales bacterium]|nr:hypothetical protein [Myxococcales bacterium]